MRIVARLIYQKANIVLRVFCHVISSNHLLDGLLKIFFLTT